MSFFDSIFKTDVGATGSKAPGVSSSSSATTQEKPKKSFWDGIETQAPVAQPTIQQTPAQAPTAPAASVPSDPYFYKQYPSGATVGFSQEKDTSGKPFFDYRNPGDTSTTTDKMRVASTFDPATPKPLTKDEYYNPRAKDLRDQFNAKYGIKPSEELDHAIALAVGGSNQPENLRAIPAEQNQKAGKFELELAQKLARGEISYFDAQVADAKAKGIKLPWTPPDVTTQDIQPKAEPTIWDKLKSFVGFGAKATPPPAPVSTTTPPVSVAPKSIWSSLDTKYGIPTAEASTVPVPPKTDMRIPGATSISSPSYNASSIDVHDKDGYYVGTFKGANAYADAKAKSDAVGGTMQPSTALGVLGRMATAAYGVTKQTIDEAAGKLTDATLSVLDPKAAPSERAGKIGDGIVGMLNIAFAPFTATMAAAKETAPGPKIMGKEIPSAQSAAKGIDAVFKKIGEGSTIGVDKALSALPIPEKTKEDIKPFLTDLTNLVVATAAGHLFHMGAEKLKADIIEKTNKVGSIIDAEWSPVKEKQGLPMADDAAGVSFKKQNPAADVFAKEGTVSSASDFIKEKKLDENSVSIKDDKNSIVENSAGNDAVLTELPVKDFGKPKFETLNQDSYAAGRSISSPIEATFEDGKLTITDGANRFTQAVANGDKTIPVVVNARVKGQNLSGIDLKNYIDDIKQNSEVSLKKQRPIDTYKAIDEAKTPRDLYDFAEGEAQVIPISKLNLNEDSMVAAKDVASGRGSVSKLPVLVEKQADGTYDIIEGNHRVAETSRKGNGDILGITDKNLYNRLAAKEDTFFTKVSAHDRTGTAGVRQHARMISKKPVEAFKKGTSADSSSISAKKQGVPFNTDIAEAKAKIDKLFNPGEISFLFPKELEHEGEKVWGKMTIRKAMQNPLIEVVQSEGKISDKVLYHESFHAYVRQFMSPEDRNALMVAISKNPIAALKMKLTYEKAYGKNAKIQAEEYAADAFADWMKGKDTPTALKSIFQRILDTIRGWVRKLTGLDKTFEDITAKKRDFVRKESRRLVPETLSKLEETDRTVEAFNRSSEHDLVGKIGDKDAVIGTFGKNAIERKTAAGQSDRLPVSEISKTIDNLTGEVYRSGDSAWRKDNTVRIAKMPSGQMRALITRTNHLGQEEVVNFFKIGRDYEKFVENLKPFGIPGGSRTRIASLEEKQSNPLTYGDKANDTGIAENVKGAETTPEAAKQNIQASLDKIAKSKSETEISDTMANDFQMDPKEAKRLAPMLVGVKSARGVRNIIEGFDRVRRGFNPENYPEDIQQKELELEMRKEALDLNPVRDLIKYTAKTGEFAGRLPEVLGGKVTPLGKVIGEFGRRGDDIVTELGFEGREDANDALARYNANKDKVQKDLADLKAEKKAYRESLQKSAETQPARKKPEFHPPVSPYLPGVFKDAGEDLPKLAGEVLQNAANRDFLLSKRQAEPIKKIVIDMPKLDVKKKVGILDYLRTPDRVLKRIGLGPESDFLKESYNNYLLELPAHLDVIKDWMKRAPEGKERLFDYLDGQVDITALSSAEKSVAGEMKTYLRNWADRLDIPYDERISHYITHIFDATDIKQEFDPELAKLITDKIPGSVFDPFLLERIGRKGYIRDVWKSLEAYTKRAVRKANMDPVLETLKEKGAKLELSQYNYVKRYLDAVNKRPTEAEDLANNTIKQIFGYRWGDRPALSITTNLRMMVYRGALYLNPKSALKNLTQGVNTYAKLGEKYTLIGYTKMLTGQYDKEEILHIPVVTNNMIEERLSAKPTVMERFDKAGFALFSVVEKVNRISAYLGAKAKAMDMGMNLPKAMKYAEQVVKDTQFSFSEIETPVAMRGPIMKTVLQFGTFSIKQQEFINEMVKSRNYAGLIRYVVASALLIYGVGQALGLKAEDAVAPGATYAAKLVGWGSGGRFGGPPVLSPLKATYGEVSKAVATGKADPVDMMKNVLDSLVIFLPGGIQGQRMIGGLKSYYTADFDKGVQKSVVNFAKASIFGKSALDTKTDDVQAIYDKAQSLTAKGDAAGAKKIVDALSDNEYEIYKKIKASATAKKTIQNKLKMQPVYEKVQSLKKAGKDAEAQKIIDALSDEEYKAYLLVKKQNAQPTEDQ